MLKLRMLLISASILMTTLTMSACEPTASGNPSPLFPLGADDGVPEDTTGDPPDDPLDDPLDDPPDSTDTGDDPPAGNAYPRVAAFAGQWDMYSPTEQAELAQFDLISLAAPPAGVNYLRRVNPDMEIFYRVMPQLVAQTDWGFEWSWMDIVRRYADANDWILRHHNDTEAVARGWGTYWRWGDFTSRCPLGVYFNIAEPDLDSRGLTMAEWMATRFIPWFASNRLGGYDGFWWEVVAEEVTPYWWHTDTPFDDGGYVDWNRNGVADLSEGELDRFAAEWDSVSTWWMAEARSRIETVPIIGGGDRYAPPLENFDGFKNEDFLNRNRFSQPFWTWWDEFYVTQTSRPRRGYVYQRDHQRGGWERSVNQIFWSNSADQGHADPMRLNRFVRFALGTTLLGDGYFSFYDIINLTPGNQPRNPWMSEYYDLRLGSHAYPFERVTVGADTLYVREFHDGQGTVTGRVSVNPNSIDLNGVPAEDALIESLVGRRPR